MPVTDDKRDGDELFEDLDKFFAPIRDVDWDEPEEPAAQAPHEEHVEVRPSESVAPSEQVEAEPEPPESEPEAPETEAEEGAWYDTGRIEPVEAEGTTGDQEGGDEITVLEGSQEEAAWPAEEEPEESRTIVLESPVDEAEEGPLAGERPSDEDLEAAAEHFAGSIRGQEVSYTTEPIDVFGEEAGETGANLLDEDEYGYEPSEVEEDILADIQEPEAARRTVVVGAEGSRGLAGRTCRPSRSEPTSSGEVPTSANAMSPPPS